MLRLFLIGGNVIFHCFDIVKNSKNYLFLITGAASSQVAALIALPILSRLYTDAQFGQFAAFNAIVAIVAVVICLRLDNAIAYTDDERCAKEMASASFLVALLFSCLVILIYSLSNYFSHLLPSGYGKWLDHAPKAIVSLMCMSYIQIKLQGLIKVRAYKKLAFFRGLQSWVLVVFQLLLGFSAVENEPLINAFVLSQVAVALGGYFLIKEFTFSLQFKTFFCAIKRARKFAVYDTPAALVNIASQQMQNIWINSVFGAAMAGQYFMAQRILATPVTLAASSVGDVFRRDASEEYSKTGAAADSFNKTSKLLIKVAIVPTLLIGFFSAEIFGIILGERWRDAGVMAEVLSILLFSRFIASPLSGMIYVAGKQVINIAGNLSLFLIAYFAFNKFSSILDAVWFYSIGTAIVYFAYFVYCRHLAKGLS